MNSMIFDFLRRSSQLSSTACGVTDVGRVRQVNEDAFADCSAIGLWAVADGMGGHDAGDLASRTVTDRLKSLSGERELNRFIDTVQANLSDVNRDLFDEAQRRGGTSSIGCTVVLLLVVKDRGALLWAGDSRAYRLRGGTFQAVTRDHSQVEDMVDQGLIKREEAENHPMANAITNAVGPVEKLNLELKLEQIKDGDRYLLCSDGLYREVADSEIAEVLQSSENCAAASQTLLQMALDRGAKDNVTVMIIDFSA